MSCCSLNERCIEVSVSELHPIDKDARKRLDEACKALAGALSSARKAGIPFNEINLPQLAEACKAIRAMLAGTLAKVPKLSLNLQAPILPELLLPPIPIARRDPRKLDTQKQYKAWQKAYREGKRKHPGKSDDWHSKRIAMTDIANGRASETIRKHMKR